VTRNDDSDPTEHVYFQGDDFYVENVRLLEIYDPDTCIVKVYGRVGKSGKVRWSRQ